MVQVGALALPLPTDWTESLSVGLKLTVPTASSHVSAPPVSAQVSVVSAVPFFTIVNVWVPLETGPKHTTSRLLTSAANGSSISALAAVVVEPLL